MNYDEAIKTLNTFRNAYYNYTEDEEKKNVAQALDVVLPKHTKVEELLVLYKELAIVRFYLFSETDADLGQELMNKDDDLNKQIKQLEEELNNE